MKTVLVVVALSACASTTPHLDHDIAPRTGVQLSLVPSGEDAARVIPAAIAPRLPRVDRLARQLRYELGDTITADVSLCVSPDGNVTEVALAKPSPLAELDAALIADVGAWQFAPLPGAATLRTCQQTTIAYRVP